jgi:hypothetical protein
MVIIKNGTNIKRKNKKPIAQHFVISNGRESTIYQGL